MCKFMAVINPPMRARAMRVRCPRAVCTPALATAAVPMQLKDMPFEALEHYMESVGEGRSRAMHVWR